MPESFKILIDQNIPVGIAQWLRSIKSDWDVTHTSELQLNMSSDETIFNWAVREEFAILTFDEDFADRRTFPVTLHFGIIRLRVWPTTTEEIQNALLRVIASVDIVEIKQSLIIVDKSKIRITDRYVIDYKVFLDHQTESHWTQGA